MLQIYNTLTQKKEAFKPIHENKIGMYVCGVTVYDYCHIGHARTYAAIDVIIRYLKWRGYELTYVRNITDIDDKIINRANENKESYSSITSRFIKAMHEDFAALTLLPPDFEPKATEFIPQMIDLIQSLINKNHAYVAENGDVYFDVRSFKHYGCLSHHNLDELESGARVDVSHVKKDPLDFVVWKLAKPGEPSWPSPWGEGRPGWHTECSAMGMQILGKTFDIHGGGRDLIFPHHENEIAQSEGLTEQQFVNYWMHTGFLQIEKEKMSKSLGNFVTIRDALAKHDSEVVRFFLIASHYRSPLIYAEDTLAQTKQSLARFYTALRYLPIAEPIKESEFEKKFVEAMDDDFNTPVAFAVLFDLAREVNRLRDENMEKAASYAALLKNLGNVLGLLVSNPEDFLQSSEVDAVKIESLIEARKKAREEKNWSEADRIRQELANMNITIEDGATGTTWRSSN